MRSFMRIGCQSVSDLAQWASALTVIHVLTISHMHIQYGSSRGAAQ